MQLINKLKIIIFSYFHLNIFEKSFIKFKKYRYYVLRSYIIDDV